jgi:outer membrane receptor protein involved in Fe transport
MKTIYLILAPFLLFAEVDLGDINVDASEEQEEMDFLIQKESFLPNAPMQQQLTTTQALGMAGTNGDPVKALKTLAGVVSTNNDDGSEIYIHGSKPRETTFSINHLPLGYVFHAGGIHSVIAPEATEQIDAYLGGFDTTYGSMGAVVDITPKYPQGSNNGRIHVGLYDADFAYDSKLGENTSLFLSGRRSYIDLFAAKIMDNLEEDERDNSKKTSFTLFPQYYDANLILSHNVGDHTFSFEAITAEDKMKLNTNLNETKDPVANGKINSKYGFTTLGARWNYMGENYESMTLFSQMKSEEDTELFDDDFFIKTSTISHKLYHETVFDVEGHKPLVGMEIEKINAPVKIHFANSTGDEDFEPLLSDQEVLDYDKTINAKQYALFAQDIWEITEDDHFRYGLRAWKTDFQKFGSGIDPRVAYVHDFADGWSSSFAVGRYSQLPSVTYALDGFGNPLLEATEFSNHYAFNITKKFDEKSSLVVEPYFKTFDNLAIADKTNNYEGGGKGEA